jgi:hypothetical protein
LTYADALLKLSQDAARDGLTRFYTDDQILAFIRLILNELKGTPVLVLAEAINLRGCWKWLANTQILRDRIGFGGGDSGMTATAYPGMRLVRVRLCEQDETPECFGEKVSEDGAVTDFGLTQGLFALSGDRVFGSVGNKPHTAGKFSPKLSKITGWASSALDGTAQPRKPNIHGWNPQMVEFTVAVLQPQDEHAWPWAAIADGLRTSAVHHEDALLLPWPLHLAKGSLAYVLPVRPDPDLEDDALDHEGSDDLE